METVYLVVHLNTSIYKNIPIIKGYDKKDKAERELKKLKRAFEHSNNKIEILKIQIS